MSRSLPNIHLPCPSRKQQDRSAGEKLLELGKTEIASPYQR